MSAIISHHPNLKHVVAEVGEAIRSASDPADDAPRTVAPTAEPAEPDTDRLASVVADSDRSTGPGRAASAVPVVVSLGILFALAIGLAFGGRAIIDAMISLLGG